MFLRQSSKVVKFTIKLLDKSKYYYNLINCRTISSTLNTSKFRVYFKNCCLRVCEIQKLGFQFCCYNWEVQNTRDLMKAKFLSPVKVLEGNAGLASPIVLLILSYNFCLWFTVTAFASVMMYSSLQARWDRRNSFPCF